MYPDIFLAPKTAFINFNTLFLNLNLAQANKDEIKKKPKDMTFAELRNQISEFRASGIETFPLLTELYKRLTLAFSVIVFILIGLGLAMIVRRREKSINLAMAMAVTLLYYILLLGASALSLQGYPLAMWLPNLILGAIGLILTIKTCVY